MTYDIYKNVRNASWQCLIDCHIDKLPTALGEICKSNGIQIIKNSTLEQSKLSPNERGRTMYIDGKCVIIVRDTEPLPMQRYTIAHEIGHILLGDKSTEQECERFAIGILAPACVLWALNANTADEIAQLCNISHRSAEIRAERMKILNQRNKYLTHPLERQVFKQFEPFISLMGSSSH